jgi:predicted ATPase
MTFLTELAEVLANANNAMAGVFLRNHTQEIVALVEAAEVINNRREDIFQHDADFIVLSEALAALDKEPIDPNKWAFDRGLESY